ncbi:hypothetical protein SKAU_G00169360 [Synaphobranchus kaupii]|uniref:LysM and putative peptidoglycan-binding domain-containing protein 4 n=1 Tax=Synaphobranchus kaupii TaxID=118154 RepID=A0A9Q1FK92_SYNKA|nr:hypothetical protein SKAU_G00169360 [Synaphobranchus kaupii]
MRRGEPVPRAFQAPVDVHASVDGQVYLFRGGHEDSAESSEEEEFSMTELRPRSRDSGSQERERAGDLLLLERDVVHGDNLNKLALQYGCKVADIKRVNNLIQEQDLYALKSIKIPVKKHSFLTEGGGAAHPPEVEPGPSSGAPPPSTHPAQSWAMTPNGSAKPRLQEYTDFLKEVDQDIEMLIQSTDAQDAIFSERQEGPQRGAGIGRPTSYGADWGIQWWNAVVVMLLVGIILPLFYIVYYKTQDSGASAASEGVASVLNSTSGGDRSNLSALTQKGSQPHVLNRPLL